MNLISVKELLENDHREIGRLFDRAMQALDGGRPATAHKRLDLFWLRLAVHIRAEHKALYPRFEELLNSPGHSAFRRSSELAGKVGELRREHDDFMLTLADSVADLKKSRQGMDAKETAARIADVKERMLDLAARLERHNQEEESTVYPLIDEWETPSTVDILHSRLSAELQRLPSRAND